MSSYANSDPLGVETEVTVHRLVDFEVGDGDGRTLLTRVIPWNTPTQVSDPPHHIPYLESWAPGAFDKQLKAANRVDVLLNFEHHQGISNVVGRGVELRNGSDGLHGTFRMLSGQDADKALELVREQVATGLSVEAVVKRSERVDGVVVRKDARLVNVALCRNPAFEQAQVLAVRQEVEAPPNPDEPPTPPDDEQAALKRYDGLRPQPFTADEVERLERLGIDPVRRAIVDRPWDGSASRYADTAAYCAACLIDDNPAGADKTQAMCHLPIKEPNGDININAVRNAMARVMQVQTSSANKSAARTRLQQILNQYNNRRGNS